MKLRKILCVLMISTIIGAVGCSREETPIIVVPEAQADTVKSGEVYFLNFKPEIAQAYQEIADVYREETGIVINVVTPSFYEDSLKSALVSDDTPPTIFQINGDVGYETWKNFTADLKDTELYQMLEDKNLAITDGDGVYGIPYTIEGYGIIYNDEIMQNYLTLPNKAVNISSMEEVNSYSIFEAVVEDMVCCGN